MYRETRNLGTELTTICSKVTISIELPKTDFRPRCLLILRENLVASDIVLAAHAAEGLTEAGHGSEVRRVLQLRFVEVVSDRERCLLARELVRAGDHEKLNVLGHALEHASDAVKIVAAESLFKVRQTVDETLVQSVLNRTNNESLQLMIFAVLFCQGELDYLNAIREHLSIEDREACRIAVWLITRLGNDIDIAAIQKLRRRTEDVKLCAYIDHALAAMGNEVGIRALTANFYSSNPEVRRLAAETARLLPESSVIDELVPLLDDHDFDIRIRAAHALLRANL